MVLILDMKMPSLYMDGKKGPRGPCKDEKRYEDKALVIFSELREDEGMWLALVPKNTSLKKSDGYS